MNIENNFVHARSQAIKEQSLWLKRLLLVDDDGLILEGYRRSLGREFLMETAIRQAGRSHTRDRERTLRSRSVRHANAWNSWPSQLLTAIKAQWPDTIRVILPGNTDMETAVNAINEGSIFRFLNKPCSKEVMAKTLTAGLVQYRLVTAEKQVVQNDAEQQHPGADRSPSASSEIPQRKVVPGGPAATFTTS